MDDNHYLYSLFFVLNLKVFVVFSINQAYKGGCMLVLDRHLWGIQHYMIHKSPNTIPLINYIKSSLLLSSLLSASYLLMLVIIARVPGGSVTVGHASNQRPHRHTIWNWRYLTSTSSCDCSNSTRSCLSSMSSGFVIFDKWFHVLLDD